MFRVGAGFGKGGNTRNGLQSLARKRVAGQDGATVRRGGGHVNRD